MGKLTPIQHSDDELHVGHGMDRFSDIADRYFSSDTAKNEITKTANNIIGCTLMQLNCPKPDLMNFESCTQAVQNYFTILSAKNIRPTISGIAVSLGLTRSAFLSACDTGALTNMLTGAATELPTEVWNLFCALKENYIAMLEGFMETGLVHPASGIFLLKNNADYKDLVERKYTVTQTNFDAKAMEEKYSQELSDDA